MKRVNDWQTPVKTLPFLAVVNKKIFQSKANRMLGNRSGDGPQVNKFEQVGGGYHVTYHMRTPFYEQTEWQTDRHTTKNITFPETTYADGTCASGKENSSSRSQIFIIQTKTWNHNCYVLIFVLRVSFHILIRGPFSQRSTAFLATGPGFGPPVKKFKQVGGIWCQLSYMETRLYAQNRTTDRQTDRTENITFPQTTYAGWNLCRRSKKIPRDSLKFET